MKTIIISGACSNVGKTTLANALGEMLPGVVTAKIGCSQRKEGKCANFYPSGTTFAEVAKQHADAAFLVVESNSVAGQVVPDLHVFLNGPEMKASANAARNAAHIESGKPVMSGHLARLAARLGVDTGVMTRIAWLAGARPEPVAAIILAGGKSTRMGTQKALLPVGGGSLIEGLAERLHPHFDEILISVADKSLELVEGIRHVVDNYPGFGPLAGIQAALSASSCRVNFVVACDVPEVETGLMRRLLAYAASDEIVLPSFEKDQIEPLCAVYCRDILGRVEDLLAARRLRVRELVSACRARIVEVQGCDWYRNLNDPETYRQYVASREGKTG